MAARRQRDPGPRGGWGRGDVVVSRRCEALATVYDVRVRAALRRLEVRERFPPTPAGWARYVRRLRRLARRYRVSLRTLDKALWRLGL